MCLISGQSWPHWRSSRDNATSLGLVVLKPAEIPNHCILSRFLWKLNAEGHWLHFGCLPTNIGKKHAKRENSVNIDLEKDQGQQEHRGVFWLFTSIQGNGILHTLLMKRHHCISGFTLASLLPSPLPCTFSFVSFPFPFSSSLPISTLSQETQRTWCQHLQPFTPCPRTSGPALNWPVQLLSGKLS